MSTSAPAPSVTVSNEQRRQLDDQGFFVTDVLFDAGTVEGVRAEFERLWQSHVEHARKHGDALAIDQAIHRAFISQLDRISPVCDAFCRHPAMQEICRQLLGPDVDLTWNQAILKAPQRNDPNANVFGWHQDMWYATHGSYAEGTNPEVFLSNRTGLTMWVAITRTTVDNGTLWVLPGRHKEGLLPHFWNEAKREWEGQYDTTWKVPAVMRPGQMLVFRKFLPHASGANVSDEPRMAYQIGYARVGAKEASIDVSPLLRAGRP